MIVWVICLSNGLDFSSLVLSDGVSNCSTRSCAQEFKGMMAQGLIATLKTALAVLMRPPRQVKIPTLQGSPLWCLLLRRHLFSKYWRVPLLPEAMMI